MSTKILETITSIKTEHKHYHLQVGMVLLSRHLLSIACNNMLRQNEYNANQLDEIMSIKTAIWTRGSYNDGVAHTLETYAEDLSHELYIWLLQRVQDNAELKKAITAFSRAVKYNGVIDDYTLHNAVGVAYSKFINAPCDIGLNTHYEAVKLIRKLYRRKFNIIDRVAHNTQLQVYKNMAISHNETCDNYINAKENHEQLQEYIQRVKNALKADNVPADWYDVVQRRIKGETDEIIAKAYNKTRQAIQKKRAKIRALIINLFTDDEKREFIWLMSKDSARITAAQRNKELREEKFYINL